MKNAQNLLPNYKKAYKIKQMNQKKLIKNIILGQNKCKNFLNKIFFVIKKKIRHGNTPARGLKGQEMNDVFKKY